MTHPHALFAALRGIPKLPDAACRGRSDLFDGATEEDIAEATAVCSRCPELNACKRWADMLPHNGIHGVIAGEYREWVSHPSVRRPKLIAATAGLDTRRKPTRRQRMRQDRQAEARQKAKR
jgi:hypothetical protein